MKQIKAAVLEAYDTPFVLHDVEIDEPRDHEVLVKIVASGVCHTDGLAQHADLPFPPPGVLGHEGSGIVEAIGAKVTSVEVGDHVIIGWPWCGECEACLTGNPRYCALIGRLLAGGNRLDGSSAFRRDGGPLNSHFFGVSSFATYSITNESSLVNVEKSLPIEKLGPLACGIATGAGAVFNAAQPKIGDSLVVYGTGSVGLAAIMAAKNTGATKIIAVDLHDSRLEMARSLGATHTVNAKNDDPVSAIHDICGGPATFALECTGIIAVCRQAIDSVGMMGTAILIGGAPAGAEFSADHLTTLWGKTIKGILGGEGTSKRLMTGLLDLYQQGRFPFDRLITEFPFDQVNEALAASYAGDVLKPLLIMPK